MTALLFHKFQEVVIIKYLDDSICGTGYNLSNMGSFFSFFKSSSVGDSGEMTVKQDDPPPRDPALIPIIEKWEKEQESLKTKLIIKDTEEWTKAIDGDVENGIQGVKYIGGVDISFVKGDDVNACAAFIIIEYPSLKVMYQDLKMIELTAPYIAGFLAFRETPDLEEMINRQRTERPDIVPDVIMVDGNGTLHPKRFGLACHLGVLVDIPCLGVAKTLFHVDGIENNKQHKEKIANMKQGGDTFPLIGNSGDTLGVALRSMDSTKNPVYVSPGHKISIDTAVKVVHKCCRFRIPEPTRQADILSREYLVKHFKPKTDKQ